MWHRPTSYCVLVFHTHYGHNPETDCVRGGGGGLDTSPSGLITSHHDMTHRASWHSLAGILLLFYTNVLKPWGWALTSSLQWLKHGAAKSGPCFRPDRICGFLSILVTIVIIICLYLWWISVLFKNTRIPWCNSINPLRCKVFGAFPPNCILEFKNTKAFNDPRSHRYIMIRMLSSQNGEIVHLEGLNHKNDDYVEQKVTHAPHTPPASPWLSNTW